MNPTPSIDASGTLPWQVSSWLIALHVAHRNQAARRACDALTVQMKSHRRRKMANQESMLGRCCTAWLHCVDENWPKVGGNLRTSDFGNRERPMHHGSKFAVEGWHRGWLRSFFSAWRSYGPAHTARLQVFLPHALFVYCDCLGSFSMCIMLVCLDYDAASCGTGYGTRHLRARASHLLKVGPRVSPH